MGLLVVWWEGVAQCSRLMVQVQVSESYSATQQGSRFFESLMQSSFDLSNRESSLLTIAFTYLLSYRDHCFWHSDVIDNHLWRQACTCVSTQRRAQMKFWSSTHAEIIDSSSCWHNFGVFIVFKLNRFFSEPTIYLFLGPRGQFFSEPTIKEVKEA